MNAPQYCVCKCKAAVFINGSYAVLATLLSAPFAQVCSKGQQLLQVTLQGLQIRLHILREALISSHVLRPPISFHNAGKLNLLLYVNQ
jgi:hypothetical protein